MRKLGCFMGSTSPKTGDEKAPGLRVGLLSQTDHSFIWFCSVAVGCGRYFFASLRLTLDRTGLGLNDDRPRRKCCVTQFGAVLHSEECFLFGSGVPAESRGSFNKGSV